MEVVRRCIVEASHILDREIGACDAEGHILASNRQEATFEDLRKGVEQALAAQTPVSSEGRSFMTYTDPDDKSQAVIWISGTDGAAGELLELLMRWIQSAKLERNTDIESQSFLKNVLLENELPGDIPLKAREYRIAYNQTRQVILLRFSELCERSTLLEIRELLNQGDITKWTVDDFSDAAAHADSSAEQGPSDPGDEQKVLMMDEHNAVILLECQEENPDRTEQVTAALLRHFQRQGRKLHIGIGLPASNLKDAAKSYREASLALIVGGIFTEDKEVMWYNRLGLGRLIYQLPPTLCQMFLSEVFAPDTYEALDPETLLTIEKFFENNLNGSETSRQLFVHRNTLVYRLDKVQKITGLDLRNFDDAVLFKLASMVRQYLESLQLSKEAQVPQKRW